MATNIGGQRLVVGLYLAIVCFTGLIGYLAGVVVDDLTPPRFLFLIEFPATSAGLAAYGSLTVATILGFLLWLVTVVSRLEETEPDVAADTDNENE